MALSNHKCSLGLDSTFYLPHKNGVRANFCRFKSKLTLISHDHPETFDNFRSYSTVVAEQQRQLLEGGKHVIHPFSLLSLGWNSVTATINLMHMIFSTLRLWYVLESSRPMLHRIDYILLIINAFCLLDIAVKFNTGFQEGFPSNIVTDKRRIAARYLRKSFLLDFVSCVPVSFVLLYMRVTSTRSLLFTHIMPILRAMKLSDSITKIQVFLKVFTKLYIWHRLTHLFILFVITMHWSCCFAYSAPIFNYYWNGEMAKGYKPFFLNTTEHDFTTFTIAHRYQKAMFLCLSSFFGTGMSTYKVRGPDEYIIHSLIILYAVMLMIYTIVFVLNIYITAYYSVIRYQGLMNQVETYMRHKQFPKPLKKRVRLFYSYKYMERYYKEDTVLACLSNQLRQELTLHTCQKLVKKIKLLDDLPADVVGEILSHLKPEVFLPNDLIIRAGDVGHCMYFIAYGTVAVYSLKGVEVGHLMDGAHFGEIELLMKDNKRVVTTVAIEISHLYRLESKHFQKYIEKNPILLERIEVCATKRMHEIVLLDEEFQTQQKIKQNM